MYRSEIRRRLLARVIKPFVTADWWRKTLDVIEQLAREAPCYTMRFDQSGRIIEQVRGIADGSDCAAGVLRSPTAR